jgi:hypothetical protein
MRNISSLWTNPAQRVEATQRTRRPISRSVAKIASAATGAERSAVDPSRHLPEDVQYEGEALLRIARSRDPLLSLWSDWNAPQSGA